MNARESDPAAGAQVVGRVTSLLRSISQTMPEGQGTSSLARLAGVTRPTAHRLLSSLADQGFVDRDPGTGHWLLGPELYLLGTVAGERYDISDVARPYIAALAEATGESAFLSVRRGYETVCILREDGSFPIRSFVLYEGRRFPLGVASAGLVILSFMTPEAVEEYLAGARLEREYGPDHSAAAIRQRIELTREAGYSVNPGLVVQGSWGMGAAVFDQAGRPAWALSLTGVDVRFSAQRRPELGQLLLDAAHRLTRRLVVHAGR